METVVNAVVVFFSRSSPTRTTPTTWPTATPTPSLTSRTTSTSCWPVQRGKLASAERCCVSPGRATVVFSSPLQTSVSSYFCC